MKKFRYFFKPSISKEVIPVNYINRSMMTRSRNIRIRRQTAHAHTCVYSVCTCVNVEEWMRVPCKPQGWGGGWRCHPRAEVLPFKMWFLNFLSKKEESTEGIRVCWAARLMSPEELFWLPERRCNKLWRKVDLFGMGGRGFGRGAFLMCWEGAWELNASFGTALTFVCALFTFLSSAKHLIFSFAPPTPHLGRG